MMHSQASQGRFTSPPNPLSTGWRGGVNIRRAAARFPLSEFGEGVRG
jgi:hypothetical protein